MEKLKPIGLSFKNNSEDKKLYEWIYTHSNVSGFIKDILRREMNEEVGNISAGTKENHKEEKLLDLSDF